MTLPPPPSSGEPFQTDGKPSHVWTDWLAKFRNLLVKNPFELATFTIAGLPTGKAGMIAYASNGRKVGEGAGAGTGITVYFSNAAWRRPSDDTVAAA